MDPEERKVLDELANLARENNKILHKMLRADRWRQFYFFLRWGIVIAITVGAFYYFQPVIDSTLTNYSAFRKSFQSVTGVEAPLPDIDSLVNKFKIGN